MCSATCTSCSSATRSAVSSARVCAPMSSCTLKPHAPPSTSASTSGAGSEEEPRARKPMLTGQASKALNACRSAQGELTPTPQTGPNSWPMIVVTPEASEASMMRGESRCTWVSMAPAVAIRPSPETIVGAGADDHLDAVQGVRVPGPADGGIRPSRTPIEVLPMPRTGVDHQDVADHQVAGLAARRRPSGACRPGRSCRSRPGTRRRAAASRIRRAIRPSRPSRTRSPAAEPCTEM